jgi:hypothetical protein
MALTKKTWLWIIAAIFGLGVIGIIAIAGIGVYFVSQHVDAARSTSADASRAFEAVRGGFKDAPLIEFDTSERARLRTPVADIPSGRSRPEHLWILAWDPNDERLVKMSLPFWVMRLGRRKLDFINDDHGVDLDRLKLDVQELERIGPTLLMDHKVPTGVRVLVWTQ